MQSRRNARTHRLTRRAFVGTAAAFAASIALCLPGCGKDNGESVSVDTSDFSDQSAKLFLFDTTISLSAYCSEEAMQAAVERCNFFESKFSRTIEGSDVWNINHACGAAVDVEPETAECIAKALEYSKVSDGLFDITIGAVSSLWDFVEGVKPDDSEIQAALPHVNYECVGVEGNTVQLADPDAMIDLGGIAKGYIADDLVKLFKEHACESATINLGGNAVVLGTKPDGSLWKVGVQDPNAARNAAVLGYLECSDKSVVTSGLYERHFTKDGTDYYHILDPKTGYPAKTDLIATSVISDASVDGDAYATMLFLMGHDAALQFLNETEGIEGLVVDAQDNVTLSDNSGFVLT